MKRVRLLLSKINNILILFSAKQILLMAGVGLTLANMLLPAEAGDFDAPKYLGDKTMPDKQRQTDKETLTGGAPSVATSAELNVNKGDIQAQRKQPETDYQASYPFTADELWGKLLKLVDLPDGHVTKELVESIFGVTLMLDEEFLRKFHEHRYILKNQYMSLEFAESSATESSFEFKWGKTPGQSHLTFAFPPPGMCIDAHKIMPDIAQRGWEFIRESRRSRDVPRSSVYRKGKMGVLRLEFFPPENCLSGVVIYTIKKADQLVR